MRNKSVREKPANVLGSIFSFVIWVLAAAFCGYICVANIKIESAPWLPIVVALSAYFISLCLQTLIHEAGHLAFGLISGYGFSSFRIGSLMLLKEDNKLKIKRHSLFGTMGQCLMTPPEPFSEDFSVLLYNMGGVFANLIFSAVFLGLGLAFGNNSVFAACVLCLAAVGFALALLNGTPLTANIANDGRNALELSRDAAARRVFWIELETVKELAKGKRLKDMPDEWFVMPESAEMDGHIIASAGALVCNRAVDELNFKLAAEGGDFLLENAKGLMGLHRSYISCDLIYCELIGENRKERLDRLRTKKALQYLRASTRSPSALRVRYAMELLCYNDEKAANTRLSEFEKAAARYPYTGEIEAERELIEIARQKYYERQTASETE